MSGETVDDVFGRLMDTTDVPVNARSATLATLNALKVRYPHDTPARLLYRARREGAAIPTGRCAHSVPRGECVACDAKIGARYYFTASDRHLHTTPKCAALGSSPGGVAPPPGKREPIEVVTVEAGVPEDRERCPLCVKASPRPRTPRKATTTTRRAVVPKIGPAELIASSPPAVGDNIDWGGFSGTITDVNERGVSLSVDGVTLTAPWGDRATVRRQPAS